MQQPIERRLTCTKLIAIAPDVNGLRRCDSEVHTSPSRQLVPLTLADSFVRPRGSTQMSPAPVE